MTSWTLQNKQFGAPHPRAEYELPPGVRRGTPAADAYFRRWLQCSTLVTWCTVAEVACGCAPRLTRRLPRSRLHADACLAAASLAQH